MPMLEDDFREAVTRLLYLIVKKEMGDRLTPTEVEWINRLAERWV